jgi:hypothetical protein
VLRVQLRVRRRHADGEREYPTDHYAPRSGHASHGTILSEAHEWTVVDSKALGSIDGKRGASCNSQSRDRQVREDAGIFHARKDLRLVE